MSPSHGHSGSITLIGTMTIKPEHEEEFVRYASQTARTVTENEPGTIVYVLHKHPTENHTYVWVERYEDAPALQAHNSAAYIAEAMGKLPNWLAKPPEILEMKQLAP